MQLVKTKKFTFSGKEYEIRVVKNPNSFEVKTYKKNKRANPYIYKVDFDTDFLFSFEHNESAVDHLIKIAQSDVENGMWENYLAAMQRSE